MKIKYYDTLECLVQNAKLKTEIFLVSALVLVSFFAITYQTDFVVFFTVQIMIGLSAWFLFSIKKQGLGPFFVCLIGCITLVLVVWYPTDLPITENTLDPKAFSTGTTSIKISYLEHSRDILKEYGLGVGLINITIGMILAYRPSLIYVKNRLPFEYPYPIWDGEMKSISRLNYSMVKVSSLLNEKERWLLHKYRLILISINNKVFLVKPSDYVPEDSIILRSKTGKSLLGVG